MDGYPFSIGIIVPESERQEIKVDINNKKLNKTLLMEAIGKEVPGRLRWKKYPLCTKNLTGMLFLSLFSLFIKSDKDFGLRIVLFIFIAVGCQ